MTGFSTSQAKCRKSRHAQFCFISSRLTSLHSPSKPSRPSRAYLHVVSSDCIAPLSDQVRQASFHDARHTSHDPVLLGLPTLEFAPYAKIPGSRIRKDARQGTIDQDPEFIAFLESLTQPITKPAPMEAVDGEEKKEGAMTTPLVQFIKDKKASKAKDGAASKSLKHGRSDKESKQEKVQAKKLLHRPDKETATAAGTEKKIKGDKTTKETVKAAKQATPLTVKSGTTPKPTKETTATATPERKRERGNVTAAAKMLQRDLGLSPSGGRRRGKGGSTETESPADEPSRDLSTTSADMSKKESPQLAAAAKDGPSPSCCAMSEAGTIPPTTTTPPTKPAKGSKTKPAASPTPTATQAFLKHANPSQGVTEALLKTAFAPFGTVVNVEIDKKKGFGYVDFAEPVGLQQAIAASPVSVAQSQVIVLERKTTPSADRSRKGRGDSQPPGAGGSKAKASGESSGSMPAPSSRGSRGGRGSRNKGSKAGGNGDQTGEMV